ncbi:hypothetical protein CTheo_6666 [Ceratobasidium theobromae]|uniref:CxC1-like cysteine cluster associated with KDZ transposases domain-containing protein n=1 Tax=Ceratobasidium theobromae TaxID=1582974 RepID=A0A5N5QEE5_9AGAM|nr:hypothetical protein CTheo_6666 [Ceratobasidium theobromae]
MLHKKQQKGKLSSGHRYRVSNAPYTLSESSTSLLLPKSKSVSGRTLERNTTKFQQEYQASIANYSKTQKQDLEAVRQEIGWSGAYDESKFIWEAVDVLGDDGPEDEWIDDPENEFHSLSISVLKQVGLGNLSQSWAERLAREKFSWDQEITQVCDAFLMFNRTGPPPVVPDSSASCAPPFSILCINLTSRQNILFNYPDNETSRVVTLARHGYFSPTPTSPSCAVHVDVLRYCVALRRHASMTSLQAIAMAICEIHNVIYSRHIRAQLSAALDVYLVINRMLDSRLAKALFRDDPNWRMANACTACTYHLDNEPKLKYSMLLTCDGNDSLKRVANASLVDRRTLNSDYFLSSEYVDRFGNEVASRVKAKATSGTLDNTPKHGSKGANGHEESESTTACEERWKNAHADDSSKKVVVFDETGIFAVSCRHGSVILVEDMRQSGELSKYALAAVDKLCQVFGKDLLIGYDIGCTFRGTAQRSPLVGPLVHKNNINFVVGSFHGYAHNRKCQLSNHPLNVEGAGLESFEENEQLFSSTNTVARTTRHASHFHRQQLIVLHLGGWDFGRRCALGSILKSRYTSALRVLSTLPKELCKLSPNKTDDDWCSMFNEECKYFEALKEPSAQSSFAMLYVKRLRVLAEKEKAFKLAFHTTFTYTVPGQIDIYRNNPSIRNTDMEHKYQHCFAAQTRKIEAQRTAAAEQLLVVQTEIEHLEKEHAINPRWTPECDEWKMAIEREALDDYHEALRALELLVVQRIAELEKAHAVGTGYKARVQMSKGIKRREKAVHSALNRYNTAARSLNPPRPAIAFEELTEYAYLANFDFLKHSEHGLQGAEWSQPINRRCVELWQRIQRANEEVSRLNIEIQRVTTHIRDEEAFLLRQYNTLKSSDPNLGHALLPRIQLTIQANRRIMRDLEATSKLKGFSGTLECGMRLNSTSESVTPDTMLSPPDDIVTIDDFQHEEAVLSADAPIDTEPSEEAEHAMLAMENCCGLQ